MTEALVGKSSLDDCKRAIEQGRSLHHPFLVRFEGEWLSREQLRRFAVQWFKVARAHRHAFPSLIANIKDETLRFDLVGILWEEYGDGDATRIHATLLERLLLALDLKLTDVESSASLGSVVRFEERLGRIWGSSAHPEAFGVQFGLEYLASAMQLHFSRGLAKYPFLSRYDREYFDLHAEAEIRHIKASENGFLFYAKTALELEGLFRGVALAEELLGELWDDFERDIFPSPAQCT